MARRSKPAKRRKKPRSSSGRSWRMADLPAPLRAELRDRVAQADRGEDLQEFDQAIAEAERLSENIAPAQIRYPGRGG